MAIIIRIFIYFLTFGIGLLAQSFTRCSPWINLLVSFLIVLILPPVWSLGLMAGLWIVCAFFTFDPGSDRLELLKSLSWTKVFLCSLWTFSGFLLTLFLIWKLKVSGYLIASQREFLAWGFLVLIEVCQYKVIAKLSPVAHRIPLGYGMALFNFLMLLYWLYPLGFPVVAMVLASLLIINPLFLVLVDLQAGIGDGSHLGSNR